MLYYPNNTSQICDCNTLKVNIDEFTLYEVFKKDNETCLWNVCDTHIEIPSNHIGYMHMVVAVFYNDMSPIIVDWTNNIVPSDTFLLLNKKELTYLK